MPHPQLIRDVRAHAPVAVMMPRPQWGRLRVEGADRGAFLHNMTTQDLKGLQAGHGASAVVINQRAGILDHVEVHADETGFWVVTGPGRAESVLAWWDKYLITEDVTLKDETAATGLLYLTGPQAEALLPEGQELPPFGLEVVTLDGVALRLLRTHGLFGEGYHLMMGADQLETVSDALAERGFRAIDEADFEVLRLAWGLPMAGSELEAERNPWEARLDGSISLSKGCYLGQEVVARLNTYNKVVRYLVGLTLPEGVVPAPGAALSADDKPVGAVTSVAVPEGEPALALAYVRGSHASAGTTLSLAVGDGQIPVTTRDLPFWAGKTRAVSGLGAGA